jgi:hypothetical protein
MSSELVELSDGFNLADDVLFKEELKQPVVVLLFDLDFADVLHVWVDSYPKNRGLKVLNFKDVLGLERIILKFKVIEAKLPLTVVKEVRCARKPTTSSLVVIMADVIVAILVFITMTIHLHALVLFLLVLNGLLDLNTQRDVDGHFILLPLKIHLLLLGADVGTIGHI